MDAKVLPLQASAMTVGSWHLIGRALTLAMALARHRTNPFVPSSVRESPVFQFKRNEKFSPWLTHYSLDSELDQGNLESPRQNLPAHLVAFICTNPCSAMNLFCLRLETQCPCKIGCMLRSLRESDRREKAFLELTYRKNNIFSGLRSGRENQTASRLQGGSDRRMIADCKPWKADQLPTPKKEQRDLCNAWPTPWQVSVLCQSNAMNPRSWHLMAVLHTLVAPIFTQKYFMLFPGDSRFMSDEKVAVY
jgi:hypothetical protein